MTPALSILGRIDRIVCRVESLFCLAGLLVVFIGLIFQATARYVLKTPLFGMEEVVLIAAIWAFFFGVAYGARSRDLVAGELVSMITQNPRVLLWCRVIADILASVTSLIFTAWAFDMLRWTWINGGVTPIFGLPQTVYQLPIVIGLGLSAIHFATNAACLVLTGDDLPMPKRRNELDSASGVSM